MLEIFRKKLVDLKGLQTDIHTHVLPGVDDGAENTESALILLRGLQKLGISRVIATPHIYWDYYPNTKSELEGSFSNFKKHVSDQNIDLELELSAEYFLDEHFIQLIEKGELMPFSGDHILFEISPLAENPLLEETIFSLRINGFSPILAHVERYLYLSNQIKKIQKLKDMGCSFQLNILSLTGAYGGPVKHFAKMLLKHNLIDFLGTDIHHSNHLAEIEKGVKKSNLLRKTLQKAPSFKNCSL